jgi:hypothetical protein
MPEEVPDAVVPPILGHLARNGDRAADGGPTGSRNHSTPKYF